MAIVTLKSLPVLLGTYQRGVPLVYVISIGVASSLFRLIDLSNGVGF